MDIKGGTKTWSDAPQRTDFAPDPRQKISATDRQQHFQDENIGDILNRVSDPNWVDPSKKMRTVGANELNKDAFLSLLLTQMKNQDPTNPLKSHEMAAQLAQFTSLEKLHNINETIDGLRKDQQPNHNFQALSFIGKSISTDVSKVTRVDSEAQHDLRFNLPADAQKLTLQIKDSQGALVRQLEFKNLKAGANELVWNGMTEQGAAAPLGDYHLSFEATGSNGRKLFVETKTEGVISGVNFTPRGPQLLIGKQVVNMADVKTINDPQFTSAPVQTLSTEAANKNNEKKPTVKAENKPNAQKAAQMAGGNLNDISMAQGLINQLNKTGAKAGMGT